ncbi:restriction endonuclease subunit S [soil metagenome]
MSKLRNIESILDSVSITHKFEKDKLVFLNTSDVLEGKILIDTYMNVASLKGQAKKTIKNDDILYSEIRPKNKRYAYVNVNKPEDYVVSTKLMVLRNKTTEVLTKYVYYFLTYEGTLDYLQMRAENRIGSFPQITFDIVKILELNVPDHKTQKKIVHVIHSIDSKIETNIRINTELETMAKTLYDYWFVQFDFPDKNGKPYKTSGGKMAWNEVLKREIPSDWQDGELQEIANIKMGQSPPGESYNDDGEGMIFFQGCTDFGNRFPSVRQFTKAPTRFAKDGDILLSVRAPVGTLNIAKEDCCIGRGLAALNSKDNCIAYLFGVMINLKQIFDRRNVDGTTFGSITKDDLFSLKVVKPEKDILKKYHAIINPAFQKQNKIELENQKLSELRDWLLPMLMNGQVKVGDIEDEILNIAAEPELAYLTKKSKTLK